MADAARLKKKAAEYEAKRQWDRAISVYEQIVADTSTAVREADVPLYNRLGDLHMRMGNAGRAVSLYEKAVDLYAELGFFNNAIALCNKILRQSPNRTSVYYKLGKIAAKKGFNSDAKQNFLEYASRMQRIGQPEEAFRALKEFADLCPGQDDVRLMLAEQLYRVGKKTDALEQLQILHEQLHAEGRDSEAAATVERMRAISPNVQPRRASGPVKRHTDSLVFLDLSEETAPAPAKTQPVEGLEPTSMTATVVQTDRPLTPKEFATVELPPPAEEHLGPEERSMSETGGEPVLGLQPTAFVPPGLPGLVGFDPASFASPEPPLAPLPPPTTAETRVFEDVGPPSIERALGGRPLTPTPAPGVPAVEQPDDQLIDLGEWLRAGQTPPTTRMTATAEIPAAGQQADFEEMLEKFKQGIAQNVDAEDYGSHYDLGIAFKEMGLLDEAIAEFQKALRSPQHRVATYEALGQCFVDKQQYDVAITLLSRALEEQGFEDEQGLGVLYLLGVANESLKRHADAASFYQRVFALNTRFRDVADRLAAVT